MAPNRGRRNQLLKSTAQRVHEAEKRKKYQRKKLLKQYHRLKKRREADTKSDNPTVSDKTGSGNEPEGTITHVKLEDKTTNRLERAVKTAAELQEAEEQRQAERQAKLELRRRKTKKLRRRGKFGQPKLNTMIRHIQSKLK